MSASTALLGLARWRARRHRPAWWVGFVLAVLLAQGLGQWHRVAHGGQALEQGRLASAWAAGLGQHGAAPLLNGRGSPADQAHGHVHDHADSGLFGQHGEPECRLYDQLACADLLPLAPAPWCLPAVHHAALPALEASAAWLTPRYQRPARAPPLG